MVHQSIINYIFLKWNYNYETVNFKNFEWKVKSKYLNFRKFYNYLTVKCQIRLVFIILWNFIKKTCEVIIMQRSVEGSTNFPCDLSRNSLNRIYILQQNIQNKYTMHTK